MEHPPYHPLDFQGHRGKRDLTQYLRILSVKFRQPYGGYLQFALLKLRMGCLKIQKKYCVGGAGLGRPHVQIQGCLYISHQLGWLLKLTMRCLLIFSCFPSLLYFKVIVIYKMTLKIKVLYKILCRSFQKIWRGLWSAPILNGWF